MATRKTTTTKRAEVLEAGAVEVIEAGTVEVLGLNRDRALELAASWEREADELDALEPEGTGNPLLDILGGIALGAADGSRSQALRDCARQLRSMVGGR